MFCLLYNKPPLPYFFIINFTKLPLKQIISSFVCLLYFLGNFIKNRPEQPVATAFRSVFKILFV